MTTTMATALGLDEAGAWWGRRTGRPELATRVQGQVDHLVRHGVEELKIRELVREAAASSCSILGPGAAVPPPVRTAPTVSHREAITLLRVHREVARRIEDGTGWSITRVVGEVAAEAAHQPGGVGHRLHRDDEDVLVRACVALALTERRVAGQPVA